MSSLREEQHKGVCRRCRSRPRSRGQRADFTPIGGRPWRSSPCCGSRRDVAREERDGHQQDGHGPERDRIGHGYPEHQARKAPRRGQSAAIPAPIPIATTISPCRRNNRRISVRARRRPRRAADADPLSSSSLVVPLSARVTAARRASGRSSRARQRECLACSRSAGMPRRCRSARVPVRASSDSKRRPRSGVVLSTLDEPV